MDPYIGKFLDDRYEILDILGIGGMAVVYRAYCHRLNRYVAVKILKRELASDQDLRRRFHDESQAVAMLSHPNIVAVYDVNQHEGCEYIVMELIEGITLKQYMQKRGGKLNWREALHFITQIMQGLKHAHSRGIIHRDIKPQNVMVLRDGSVKVTDFGIARSTTSQVTMTQEAIGSVHYISPEQARGSHIDARSDIYSAGVVLYEMLTGRLPYEGDNPVAVALQHINSIPVSPREWDASIPLGIEQIALKAMSSVVDRRYANADAMLLDLEDFRKNPEIDFGYISLGSVASLVDEPTMVHTGAPGFADSGTQDATAPLRETSPKRTVARFERDEDEDDETEYDDAYDDYDDRKHSNRKFAIITTSLVVILLAIIGILYFTVFRGNHSTQAASYTVPNLVGMTVDEANSLIANDEKLKNHFTVTVTAYQSSEEYEVGIILDQTPKAERTSREDVTDISVVVSSGSEDSDPTKIVLKDYSNQDYRQVKNELEELQLVAKCEPEYSADVEKGLVIRTDPEANSELEAGASITIYYSQGPENNNVVLRDMLGLTENDARNYLATVGLKIGTVSSEYNSDYKSGEVCYQSYPANTELASGTSVDIVVSLGSEDSTEPEEPTEPVPAPDDDNTSDSAEDPAPTEPVVKKSIVVTLPDNRDGSSEVSIIINGTEVDHTFVDASQSTYSYEYDGNYETINVLVDGEEYTNWYPNG